MVSRFLLLIAALLAFTAPAMAQDGASPHIKARLIAASSVAPGGDVQLVLDYTATPGWHTYWTNPGDAGLAAKFTWNLPDGMTVTDTRWPTPKILPTLGLTSYGYDERTLVVIAVHNASTFGAGETLPVKAHVDFLVCKDVCIPESLDVGTTLKIGPPQPGPDAATAAKAVAALPAALPLVQATADISNGHVELGFPSDKVRDALNYPQGAYFFPEQEEMFAPGDPQVLDLGPSGFTLRVKAADETLPDGLLTGVLRMGDGRSYHIALSRGPLAAGVHGLGSAPAATDTSFGGIMIAMLLAFIGGLILNLMPCVFPVLSMKLLSLSRAGHDTRAARTEALVYGAGAVVSFVALALVLQLAQGAGAALGWGFQLQSPLVTAGLALVMLLVALNMSGVFEIGASLQGLGGGLLARHRPLAQAFMTGVLAVVVAAPCTAPFMATAIGVALAQGGPASFFIFLSLGVGFALPFVALTFLITLAPAAAGRLPKPGLWMDRLKHGLSVLMYLAALWLVWVFAQQVQPGGLVLLVLALVLIAAGLIITRQPPLLDLPALRQSWLGRPFVKPAVLAAGVVLVLIAAIQPPATKMQSMPSGLLPHRDFSTGTLAALREQGQPVLVDLTAAWCVTCKVNERLVLTRPAFAEALKASGTVYMVGDWTNRDADIANYLRLYGRSGVPLYVYYGRNNAAPVILPQMLNTGDLVKLLKSGH